MLIKKHHWILGLIILLVLLAGASSYALSGVFATSYSIEENLDKKEIAKKEVEEIKKEISAHIKTPEPLKAIYMTACVAGTPSFREDVVQVIRDTEINSIVIDIKDYSGTISFPPKSEEWKYAWEAAECGNREMKGFVKQLHDEGIYVIGRITVFQDPLYSKMRPDLAVQKESDKSIWTDNKGLSFIEAGAKEYWDHVIVLSNEAYDIGFDEINFDYVRFPSDGQMKDIYFPFSQQVIDADPENGKATVVRNFFKYLDENIRPDHKEENRLKTSADLFGMVTTNYDDLNIGQILEYGLPYFDYIAPMVYPSHYPNGFHGYGNPNDYPYEIVNYSMKIAASRAETLSNASTTPQDIREKVHKLQLRPWLQDFDYGGNYGPEEVRTQIQATYDAGLTSWMLWAPSNRYTKSALLSE